MSATSKQGRQIATGLAFLAPNILGVLTFVVFPVAFSLYMAFSNWDLTQHNMFKEDAPVQLIGFDNFVELVRGDRFVRFLGNTLFFMMGIPFSVAASLCAAMLLSKDTRVGGGRPYLWLLAGAGLVIGAALLTVAGLAGTAMTVLLVGTACGILAMGVTGGLTFYRTLFYTPCFVAGVATFILWKRLYSAQTGPINLSLQPVLDQVSKGVDASPSGLFAGLSVVIAVLFVVVFFGVTRKLRQMLIDGDLGPGAAVLPVILLLTPPFLAMRWGMMAGYGIWLLVAAGVILAYHAVRFALSADRFPCKLSEGFGSAFVIALLGMVAQFVLLGFIPLAASLPAMSADGGLTAPSWLNDPPWAKPALMIMGFWAAIGSNNMLLYLAALTNVPGELYEAADIDGASPLQRFWNVTWPQLAPTTFFILVMATIGGLQGGFEMARVMTSGGPAGATTTLSYFIYQEGFETGRLGFASAVAWALFLLIFVVTVFNWKFGNKYVND